MTNRAWQLVSVSLFLLVMIGCTPKVYNSLSWQSKTVVVDGLSNEWSNPLRFYDQASKLSYELTNDDENLYVVFSSKERSTIRKIMRKGLRFSIDTSLGKAKYPMQFTFPYRRDNDLNPFFEDGFARNDSMRGRRFSDSTYRRNPNDTTHRHHRLTADGKPWQPMLKVLVKGINTKVDADSLLSIPNRYGIEVAVRRDSQIVFCELKIPFAMIYPTAFTAADTSKPFFFQINLEAFEDNGQRPHRDGAEGMGGGHSGMGGGGRMGGGGGMGGGRSGMGGGGGGRGGYGGGGAPPPDGNAYVNAQNNANVIRFQFRPSLKIGTDKK